MRMRIAINDTQPVKVVRKEAFSWYLYRHMSSEAAREARLQRIYDREGRNTSSMDPKMMNARVFIGNLAADRVSRQDVVKLFEPHGKVLGVSLHKSYGFVQFENEENAKDAVKAINGKMVEGLRVDVNIATERRKELPPERSRGGFGGRGPRRFHRSPSPPYRSHHDRFAMDRHMRWERERMGWHGSPPPVGGPPYRDRERDVHFDRFPPRDPYARIRDDSYERYPRDRERFGPPRDYFGPPRDNFPPPRDRYPYDYDYPPHRGSSPSNFDWPPERDRRVSIDDWERDKRAAPPPVRPATDGNGKRIDMEIIVINRQQRDYASLVAGRVREAGLVVETQQLSPTVSLADALDSAAQRGLLYAVIITSQHEMHRSVTLTILHGRNPQGKRKPEHKNMPLEDALALIRKDFDHFMMSGRPSTGPRKPAPSSDVPHLLGKAASGASLSSNELSAVISALQKQQQQDEIATNSLHGIQPVDSLETNTPEDIQRQQADLQAKILSLLGSSAVVPSSSPSTSAAPPKSITLPGSYSSPSGSGVSYPQHSQQNSGSYSGYAGGGVGSMEGSSGYGAYGYSYR